MKKSLFVTILLLVSFNLFSQDWYKQVADQAKLISKVISKESWDSIYQFAKNELSIPKESLTDISKTIVFLNNKSNLSPIDKFFHIICDSVYKDFPYRRSGHLSKDLYIIPTHETNELDIILNRAFGKSLNSEFAVLIQYDIKVLIPELLKYLNNDALTRLCITPLDWNDVPYCLSISDVAMEIIEVKTYCDFFDNASFPEMLFSNLNLEAKNKIIENILDWQATTAFMPINESILYFLDNLTDLGHSYTYTCNNLKFLGDTLVAQGKLNERDAFMTCAMNLANYPYWDVDYEACIELMLERNNYFLKDRDLSNIVQDDLDRPTLAIRKDYWDDWYLLFTELAYYNKDDIPNTLITLMQLKEIVSKSDIPNKEKWELQYPQQYKNNFRVCDFALLKYDELIQHLEVNWLDIAQRDSCILILAAHKD